MLGYRHMPSSARRQYRSPNSAPPRPDPDYIFGTHAVDLALERRPDIVRECFISDTFKNERVLAKVRRLEVPMTPLTPHRLPGQLPRDTNHQGIVVRIDPAALVTPYARFSASAEYTDHTLLLVLAEVQDPQNVGAMIRTAAAFGVQAVLLPTHNQAPINGTVVKVSAGMAFTVPLVAIKNVNTTLQDLTARGVTSYGLAGDGDTSVHAAPFAGPTALVVGNEATGLRAKTREHCATLLHIPIHPRCESLNASAAVTASLAVWQHRKQSPE